MKNNSNMWYAPTLKNTGGALNVGFNSKDGCLYFSLAKQATAKSDGKDASFDWNNRLNLKMSVDEAADIIRAVRTKASCKFFHAFGGKNTSIEFGHYTTTDGKKEGFGLSVKKDEFTAKVGFTLGSAERLSQYLEFALFHIFSAQYSEVKALMKKGNEKKAPAEKPEEPAAETAPESTGDEDWGIE